MKFVEVVKEYGVPQMIMQIPARGSKHDFTDEIKAALKAHSTRTKIEVHTVSKVDEYGDGEMFHIMPFAYFSDLMEVYILPVHGKTLFSIAGKTSGRKCDSRCWEAEEEECVCQCAGEFHKGANSNGIEWLPVGSTTLLELKQKINYRWFDPDKTQGSDVEIMEILENRGVNFDEVKISVA